MFKIQNIICCVIISCGFSMSTAGRSPYKTGDDIIVNGKLERPNWKKVPQGWERLVLRLNKAQAQVEVNDGGVLMHFTSPDHMDQVRIKQTVNLELDKVYEFSFEYRSDMDRALRADASLLGTGVFLRSWRIRPAENWTKVRGLFYMPPTVPEKGEVIVLLQNRSLPKLWYRNVSLKATDLSINDVDRLIPPLKVHSVTSDDVFIMPGTTAQTANFLINDIPESQLGNFGFEAELWVDQKQHVKCKVDDFRISVPIDKIPIGQSTLITKMFDRSDNAIIQSTHVNIERIGEITGDIDFDNTVTLRTPDGKPYFPIGVYAGIGWNLNLKQLAGYGFNVIHSYATGHPLAYENYSPERFNKKFLDNNIALLQDAEKLGIYVMMSIPRQIAEDPQKVNMLGEWQRLYKNSPAVAAWYVDEMRLIRNTPFPLIKRSYDLIKKGDPSRQWWAYESPESELANSLDTIMIGVTSKAMAKLIKLKLGTDKGIIHVYGQVDYRNSVASSLEYNQYNFILPVIWGARGIFYYTYRNINDPKTNPLYKELKPRVLNTVQRFSKIAPAIVSEYPLPEWTNAIKVDGNMEYKVFADKDSVYIFCGVAAGAPKGGSLRLNTTSDQKIKDVLNDQKLESIYLTLDPGQGRIIEIR